MELPDLLKHPGALDNVLREFAAPLEAQSGVDVVVEIRRRQHRGREIVHVVYTGRLTLAASRDIDLNTVAVKHAVDTAAFLHELIDGDLKPFGEQLRRAAQAAAAAWDAAIER